MTPAVSTGIVATQVGFILLALLIGMIGKSRRVPTVFAWVNTLLAFVAIALAGAAAAPGEVLGITGGTSRFVVYAVTAFIAAAISWAVVAVIGIRLRSVQEQYYAKPETREVMGAELREVLRQEGIALDERLSRAEQEREQFLYALEDQHAKQIAGLAQEYQHEASTILRGLVNELAAEKLEPIIDEKLSEQRAVIEREIKRIDIDASGEALLEIRAEFKDLEESVAAAKARTERPKEENPDTDVVDQAKVRLAAADKVIEAGIAASTIELEARVEARALQLEQQLVDADALLDQRIAEAGNPLVARMTETQGAVEAQLNTWMGVLDSRFAETEQILNQRIIEQEHALEGRVVDLETAIETRLAQHVAAVEQVLASHDEQLQSALTEQSGAIGTHFAAERDRLIAELTEHGVHIQESVAGELVAAEQRARQTVEATQGAWNQFTEELEQRFAETREEAVRAAREIGAEEAIALKAQLDGITTGASSDIARQVEELGREAAWQRGQVERSVRDTLEVLQRQAGEAVSDADRVFADLERIGAERVDRIRRDAEDALVQSRDYVGQLQESLGIHLGDLRERSSVVADEMNERLSSITAASQQGASQLEQYARDVVEATTRELGNVSEQATSELQTRVNEEFAATVQASIEAQQRASEAHLAELAQRIMQQVQGDLAGLAEHARSAVTGELDQIIGSSRQHAQEAQEQAFRQVMADLARQQGELAEHARTASAEARRILDDGTRDGRRELEQAMASMGAHMREEIVRFNDEGQRRVDAIISQLRTSEQELIRDEDRKLLQAREELVRQHQGALEDQVRNLVGGLGRSLDAGQPVGSFTAGLDRPSTPLSGGFGG
ncbi:MAG: hypothetical protein H7287_10920 [Thermoleophilia bacterium]|nr:hypothetical protein [Thermoleophilia bacterium]